MPLSPRTLRITYGGLTVGSSSAYQIHRKYREQIGYEQSNVEFDFLVVGSNAAQFATRIGDVESTFRTPRLDLTVANGVNTWLSLTHTTNTGFDSDPVIIKREEIADTQLTRLYGVRINFGMPANNVGTSGRRWSTVNVAFSPSRRRTVTISGAYTAIGGTLARAGYNAAIAAYATSVLSALGGTYELAEEPTTEINSTDRVINFTRIYDEIIFSQGGATDSPSIVRQHLRIARRRDAPGDSPGPAGGVRRLLTIDVTYSCWVDKDVTQALEALWDDTIRPWIVTTVRDRLSLASVAITMERPEWHYDDNQINASMTLVGGTDLGILQYTCTVEDDRLPGVVLVPVWFPDPLAKYDYQGPETWRRTITCIARVFGLFAPSSFSPRLGHGGGFRIMQHKIAHTPVRLGLPPDEFDVTDINETVVIEFFHKPTTATVGGASNQTSASAGDPAGAEALATAAADAVAGGPEGGEAGGQQTNPPGEAGGTE